MDLGMLGLDGLVSSDTSFATSDPVTKPKWYGSGCLKQDRSDQDGGDDDVDDWRRSFKVAKTSATSATAADDYFSSPKAMLLHQQQQQQQQRRGSLLRSNTTLHCDGQQMLSFSSVPTSSQTVTFPYYNHSSTAYGRNITGYGSGGLNVISGVRDPFTPSQWMELEHQALIYKYITSNVPVPSNLLLPIKKALESAAFCSFSGTSFGPTAFGWGGFRLGFSGAADPEPGRCRRTDGKKWRCSRDAVPEQKYCERHMNRGRHRSRKPVEGQATGHSVSGPTTAATTTPAAKLMPMASSASATVVPGGGASNNLGLSHNPQLKNMQPCASSPNLNRISLKNESLGETTQDVTNLSMLSPAIDRKEKQLSIPTRAEFASVCSDYLLNPLHKNASLISCRNYGSSQDVHGGEKDPQNPVHQFMDDWPKTQTNDHRSSAISWPRIDLQPDRTQLSISIPVSAASDFMSSSTSSPANDQKLAPSPHLRLSREELDSMQMGLGVGSGADELNQRQANWIPISWETSMGGPLGEVLHNSSTGECRTSSSALNLMNDNSWEGSPRLAASSPTGVLQRMTFGSFSNSSAGSSPRAENNNRTTHVGVGLCNGLGSTLVNSGSLAAL